ncbi:MAG: FAD-dependent oxidoreductase [Treponema sp.]|nr:FAD-dependent oxidoreductase [Treponema sp.]
MTKPDADLIIVGAGPAGLSSAQYGARSNLNVLVLEQLAPGGQVNNIDVLENYPGNFSAAGALVRSGYEFAQDMYKQAEAFGARFESGSVTGIRREAAGEGCLFILTLSSGQIRRSPAVVIATGARRRKLGINGEERFNGKGVSYCATCDGPFFKNKKIIAVGGGDAACDEAQYLSRLSSQIILIHRRDRFRAQKALAERILKNPHIEVRFNTRLFEIKGDKKVNSVILENIPLAERTEEEADAVFIFAGAEPRAPETDGLDTDAEGYICTDQSMASSIPGLFAAGDVRTTPFRQVATAVADGAIAAHSAAEYLDRIKGEV